MTNNRTAFDILFDLLQQISDGQMDMASEMMRRYNAGVSLDAYPRHLATIVTQVPKEARGWFETVLCVRAQQAGRKGAWSRFAEDAFREISPCMLDEMAATGADSPPSI
jgi:hypothetical protein